MNINELEIEVKEKIRLLSYLKMCERIKNIDFKALTFTSGVKVTTKVRYYYCNFRKCGLGFKYLPCVGADPTDEKTVIKSIQKSWKVVCKKHYPDYENKFGVII